ncbi:Arginine biosynthesis bifunctional protein ArgJ beta chain like [Actinidia chinensis var. chinensis]|uniref:Arginine biosynthesis bifunctional protein ArgJ beta chain like n=1 Tax=Actinidia chinensis var. chinensis TaxID=1590841 RepID=A0A2R6P4E5_ACTCC|nr:Arginine biosynthesis bifunctional protein ArgJ beta chain like [Actinidia chinensis var. chinensis]
MSVSQRVVNLAVFSSSTSSSSPSLSSRTFLFFRSPFSLISRTRFIGFLNSVSHSTLPQYRRTGGQMEQVLKEKPNSSCMSLGREIASATTVEDATNRLNATSMAENSGQTLQLGSVGLQNHVPVRGQQAVWKPKAYGTVSEATPVEVEKAPADRAAAAEKSSAALSKLFKSNIFENFTVDNFTYSLAKVRATFYPKFENEKSDQEVRTRMIEMVSKGLATLEVSLKHSGSLFMYAGHEGGAYAKNSFGNIYTAVGVFVLGRMFREAWGAEASKKQAQFNDFLESNRMCISMELVTAVLGDHGQRPRDDYVVVTAVTELGNGKPKFYSTPDIIAFCRKWRLPTNHVWLFSTRKSVTSFFAAYDALCEEGTATPVCKALDEVADISVPASKDHIIVQGEILEGLVARMVNHESSKYMEKVLRDFPPQPLEGADLDLGPSLREICAANRSDEKQQIKAILGSVGTSFCPDYLDWFANEATDSHSRNADRSVLSKFLQAHPADFSTTKLQEMVRLMRERHYPAAFKCYHNFHKVGSISSDNLFFKMVIHVHSDSVFRRYQKEMRILAMSQEQARIVASV